MCFRCGMRGHRSRTCRTPKHLVNLYQASLKGKGKTIETNFADLNDAIDLEEPMDPNYFMDFNNFGIEDYLENHDNLIDGNKKTM